MFNNPKCVLYMITFNINNKFIAEQEEELFYWDNLRLVTLLCKTKNPNYSARRYNK